MTFRPAFHDPRCITVEGVHPATLDDQALLAQSEIHTGRVSGPGGQHRNTTDTAVTLRHVPTGIEATATERRSQGQNRSMALFRLRLKLAVRVRTWVHRDRHQPSELWQQRRQGEKMSVNPEHKDYPALLAEALDVVVARRFDVAGAAGVLGITMSQLARLIRHHKHAFGFVNEGRDSTGLPKLK